MILTAITFGGLSVILLVVHQLRLKSIDRHITKMMYGQWMGYYRTPDNHYTKCLGNARHLTAKYLAEVRKKKEEEILLQKRVEKWRKEEEKKNS